MDAKAIEDQGKQLAKASSEGDPPATLIALLEPLKSWTASEKLLRQTKIGIQVNKLRQNKDASVARAAAGLVNKWKQDVKKPASAASATGGGSTPDGLKKSTINGTASPARTATPKQEVAAEKKNKSKFAGAPEKRSTVADGVDTAVTGNATRDACVKLMYDGLAFMSEEQPEDILPVARAVELAAFNEYQPETSSTYKTRLRTLFQNLKNKSNPQLRIDVLNGTIDPARFVVMTHEQMQSEEQRQETKKLQKENMDKAMVPQAERSISASLTCGKCGQKKVSYSQAQTRSADEPMTTFCECTVCGNRWKFS